MTHPSRVPLSTGPSTAAYIDAASPRPRHLVVTPAPRSPRNVVRIGRPIIALIVLLLLATSLPGWAQSPPPSPVVGAPIDLGQPLAGPDVLSTDQAAADAVGAIRAATFGDDQVAAAIDLLASVGVAVVDQASGQDLVRVDGEPSPLRFLDWQARAMALEAWAGSGSTGADLDTVVLVPDDTPLASSFIAAWLASADTRAGRLGRALMAGQDVTDPTTLVVPGIVLALLTADLTADAPSGQAMVPSRRQIALAGTADMAPRTAQGICTGASAFIENVIGAVFEALKVTVPDSGVGAVLAGAWNWLVSRGQDLVRAVANALTEPVRAAIRSVVGGIAVATQAIAAIVPYAVTVTADPGSFTLPVDPLPPQTGSFRATVTAGDLPDWPAVLQDCAQAAGTSLPSFRPGGEPVSWSAILYADGRVFRGSADATLDRNGSAELRFFSATESPELADGDPRSTTARVTVTIRRTALEDQARQLLLGQLLGGLPDIVRPYVEAALRPLVDGLLSRLQVLTEARGAGTLVVVYHVPRETPTPGPTAEPGTPQPDDAVWVHFERPAAERVTAGRILELVACDGPEGPWSGWLATGGLESTGTDPFAVPFAYFPIAFTPPDDGSRVVTTAEGVVDVGFRQVSLTFVLEVIVEEDVLRIRQLNETSVPWYAGLSALPIEPAPAGMCPDA